MLFRSGVAQLKAVMKAAESGIEITPVWNKSNREHTIIHSEPSDTRYEADSAVNACSWDKPYFVDADHINLGNVERFVEHCDFFTIDVADYIGKEADSGSIDEFVRKNMKFTGKLVIPGIEHDVFVEKEDLYAIGKKFLYAIQKAEEIYSYIVGRKGEGNFITEVSMDEVDSPQTPEIGRAHV